MAKESEIDIDQPEFPDEVVSFDVKNKVGEAEELAPETILELLRQAEEEDYEEEIGRQTDDVAIQEALAERQDLAAGGDRLHAVDAERTAVSPVLSGGDVDAAWDQANVAGEETVGGTVPTPDQDRIDEIGEAMGLVYEDDEPLHGAEKLHNRDENRWELEIESHLPAGREDADPPYLKENRPRMNEKKETLEKQGYQFIIEETDSKDPKGTSEFYYRVVVKYAGETVGSRSEIDRASALERAIELAELHAQNPMEAEEETLAKPAS